MTAPWALSIDEASILIGRRELGVRELVASVLGRLNQLEPDLMAWAYVDEASALRTAGILDDEITRSGVRSPLHGVPIGVKDLIDIQDMPTRAGSAAFPSTPVPKDASVVARLRSAGAVFLGKTVSHELAWGQNRPPTRNPWDRDLYAGGSSVGSGVATSTGTAMAALGTDTGGSIRNPASVTGIVGMRPSDGVVDRAGVTLISPTLDQVGPLTRTVADCALLIEQMLADGVAPSIRGAFRKQEWRQPPAGTRVGVDVDGWHRAGASPAVCKAVTAALDELRQLGVHVVEIEDLDSPKAYPTGYVIALKETAELHGALLGTHPMELDPATRVLIELSLLVSDAEYERAREAQRSLTESLRGIYRRHKLAAIVSPTLLTAPPRVSDFNTQMTAESNAGDLSSALVMLSAANVCKLPALSVPCGFDDGLPIGLQLLGRPHGDIDLLRIAYHYEQVTQWRHWPP